MKSNRGVTLLSLMMYILLIILVMGIFTMISKFFYGNTKYITDSGKYVSEYNKFNMYFIDDVKNNRFAYLNEDGNLVFADGTGYTFLDGGIYRNKVKVCSNITFCSFEISDVESGGITKKVINVKMLLGGEDSIDLSTNYVLKYW